MANSKQIVYLSQTQYAELIANGSITVDGVTVTYNEDDIYMTPQAEPITDVKMAGASITTNGIAEIPIATSTTAGAFKTNDPTFYITNGNIRIDRPSDNYIRGGTDVTRVPTIAQQHKVVFYGLAKAAGDTTQAAYDYSISNTEPGNYTPEAKGAIQTMLGTNTMLAPDENDLVADRDYAIGDLFTANGKVYKATAEILTGVAIVTSGNNANCEETTIADAFVKDVQVNGASIVQNGKAEIPLMGSGTSGLIQYRGGYGLQLIGNYLLVQPATDTEIKNSSGTRSPIASEKQHASVFYGLAKAAGDTTQSQSSNAVGTYTDSAKSAIRSMIGAANADDIVAVQDTQPTSEDNKIWLPETAPEGVEIPTVAEMNTALAEKVDADNIASEYDSTATYAKGSFCRYDGKLYFAKVQISTAEEWNSEHWTETTLTTYMDSTLQRPGIIGITPLWSGVRTLGNGELHLNHPSSALIKAGSDTSRAVIIDAQHEAAFYGLAKAAGDTTQSQSANAVGQYTDAAKTAIKAMLGIEEGSSSSEVVTPIDDTAGVGDTAKVWSADKTSTEINNIIDTVPTEELAADLLMQEETNTYLNEKFLSSIHNMFESLPQDEILSEILDGLVDGNSLLRQLYHELEARKLAAE